MKNSIKIGVPFIVIGAAVVMTGAALYNTNLIPQWGLLIFVGVCVLLALIGAGIITVSVMFRSFKQISRTRSNPKTTEISVNKNEIRRIKFFYQKVTPLEKAICMITKIPLDDEEDVLQCPQCENYFLGSYLREWVNDKSVCPVCKTKLKIIMNENS